MKHLFQTSLFKQILLVILASLTLSSPALASIQKAQAQKLCGVSSSNTDTIIRTLQQATNSNDLNKIFGCSALALSLGNEKADIEGTSALIEISDLSLEIKFAVLGLLNSIARDAALLDSRYYPGLIFSLLYQNNFDQLDQLNAELQQAYSNTFWVLIGLFKRDPKTTAFSYYLAAQALYRGQGIEQDFDAAKDMFEQSVNAYESTGVNLPDDISMSRAKLCFLTSQRAETFQELRQGFLQCFKIFGKNTNDLGALQIATGAVTAAASLNGLTDFKGFWLQNYDHISKVGMTNVKAKRYLQNRCQNQKFCDAENFLVAIKSSTTAYETHFTSASIKHRVSTQISLRKAGLYNGEIDGLWGNQTRTAVGSFSSNTNIPTFEVDRFDQKLLGSYPATDRDINMSIAKIHERAKGKRIRNYASNYQIIELDVPKRIFRLDPELDPLSARSRVGLSNSTSIMHRGRLITCNTVGIFTQCF